MQNSLIYGMAILFSLLVYLLFVMPLQFKDMLYDKLIIEIIILIFLLIFPLFIAWVLITRGVITFFFSLPFYFLSLISLYRGFYFSDQFSIFKSMGLEFSQYTSYEALMKIEGLLLYILIAVIGIIVSLFLSKRINVKK